MSPKKRALSLALRLSMALVMLCVGAVLSLVSPAAAVVESEPNDLPSQAMELNETSTGNGVITGGNDIDYWSLALPAAGLLTVQFDGPPSCGGISLEGPDALSVAVGAEFTGAQTRIYRLVAPTGGTVLVHLCASYGSGDYTLFWDFTTDLSAIAWVDDQEPNNVKESALTMTAGSAYSGRVGTGFLDIDWWTISSGQNGWLVLNLSQAPGVDVFVFNEDTRLDSQARQGSITQIYKPSIWGNVYLKVSASGLSSDYTIRPVFMSDVSVLWQGADEIEPNSAASNATPLTAGGAAREGTAALTYDELDTWSFTPTPGTFVTITIQMTATDPSDVEVTLLDSGRLFEWVGYGTSVEAHVLAMDDTPLVFQIACYAEMVDYRISIDVRHKTMLSDGELTLEELQDDPDLGLFIDPRQTAPASAPSPLPCPPICTGRSQPQQGWDLSTGDGWMWGNTLCAALDLDNTVPGIAVKAGLWLWPEQDDLQSMVVSRTTTLTIEPGERACFRAMSHNESGLVGSKGHQYTIHGYVQGDAAKVIAYIDTHFDDDAGGQLALWSVTSGTTAARAREWSASDATIAKAESILRASSTTTPMNPDYSGAYMVLAAVLAFVIIIAVVAYKFRPSKPLPPPPGTAGPYMGSTMYGPQYSPYQQPGYGATGPYGYRPAAPSYPPPPPAANRPTSPASTTVTSTATPGAVPRPVSTPSPPAAASGGWIPAPNAPPRPGAPPTWPPAPPAPPRPMPAVAPPAPPPPRPLSPPMPASAPPAPPPRVAPPAPIKTAHMPVLSEGAAPTRPGQLPAQSAAIAAANARPAYTQPVNCPRCFAWVARGAPYCTRCMSPLYWR